MRNKVTRSRRGQCRRYHRTADTPTGLRRRGDGRRGGGTCHRANHWTCWNRDRSSAATAVITGSNGYEETANSDVVVITAGIARRPGMSRDDLLLTNMRITSSVTEQVVRHSAELHHSSR